MINLVFSRSYVYIVSTILLFTTAFSFLLGDGNKNLLLIGMMLFSPIIILFIKFKKIDKILLFFSLTIVFFPIIFNSDSIRWSTILYTYLFITTFICYSYFLREQIFSPFDYIKILKYLIYAYFIVLVIQQICVLIDIPVFNASNYDSNNKWKLNSLSVEPSHSVRIVVLLTYCYIVTKELLLNRKYLLLHDSKEDKFLWIAFLWIIFTSGSATGFLMFAILLLKFLQIKNIIFWFLIFLIPLLFIDIYEITAIKRAYDVFLATLTFDTHAIIQADHSASVRIVPIFILYDSINLTTIHGLFGFGIDYVSTFLSKYMTGVPDDFTSGGLLQFCMEYGIISFILFVIFSCKATFSRKNYISIILWFFLVFMSPINTQIVWLTIILLYTNKYFEKRLKNENIILRKT